MGWASLLANVLLVVTGGAVRLTGSGLGCPTWPRCTDGSFVPHGALDIHQAIEFGNRTITFVLTAVAVVTFVVAWRSQRRDLRGLALVLALGVPTQAVIGGIVVLSRLNPWLVSLHMLCSLAMTSVAVVFIDHTQRGPGLESGLLPGTLGTARVGAGRRRPSWPVSYAWATYVIAWAVLYLGTVVTGAGPHAGDVHAHRNGLSPLQTAQVHADVVMLFTGLSVGLCVLTQISGSSPSARRAASAMLGVVAGQATVGFVQYFMGIPIWIDLLHMLGAALTIATATWALLCVRRDARRVA